MLAAVERELLITPVGHAGCERWHSCVRIDLISNESAHACEKVIIIMQLWLDVWLPSMVVGQGWAKVWA